MTGTHSRSARNSNGALVAAILAVCFGGSAADAETRQTVDLLKETVSRLASDEYEGRAPGTRGETRTADFIAQQFRSVGLQPMTASFRMPVALRQLRANQSFVVKLGDRSIQLRSNKDIIVQPLSKIALDGGEQVVFAGFGIDAPEGSWDDFRGVDVRGKIVVVLGDEPDDLIEEMRRQLSAPATDGLGEHRRTYHRWVWMKQLRAAQRGAKALIIVVPDTALSKRRAFFQDDYMLPAALPPWQPPLTIQVSETTFEQFIQDSGRTLTELKDTASNANRIAVPLAFRLVGRATVTERRLTSANVVGTIPGSGAGCVVVTAHWDGYGMDRRMRGNSDNIWNGAVDDAGGVAQLIELARALAKRSVPRRTIVFAAVTGEERGFLGARQLLVDMPCSPNEIAAAVNLDWFYELGRTQRFGSHGLGYSSIDNLIAALVNQQGRRLTAVNAYMGGGDQLPFLLAGIPGFHGGSMAPLIDRSDDFEERYYERRDANAVIREGNSNEDEFSADWDLGGALEDLHIYTELTWQLANANDPPCWLLTNGLSRSLRLCQ